MDRESLHAIANDLREAAGYERVQLTRRRGLVTLQLALFLGGLTAWGIFRLFTPTSLSTGIWFAITLVLFLVAAISTIALRGRPAWNAVFLSYEGKRNAATRWYKVALVTSVVAIVLFDPLQYGPLHAVFLLLMPLAAFGPGFRGRDWSLFHLGWASLSVTIAILLFPQQLAQYTIVLAPGILVLPMAGLTAFRLLAPARWLLE